MADCCMVFEHESFIADGLVKFGKKPQLRTSDRVERRLYRHSLTVSAVTLGAEHYLIGGGYHVVRAGEALVVPPGVEYQNYYPYQTPSECYFFRLACDRDSLLGLTPPYTAALLGGLLHGGRYVYPVDAKSPRALKQAYDRVAGLTLPLPEAARLRFYNQLVQVLLGIAAPDADAPGEGDRALVRAVSDWLEDNLAQDIDLRTLADRFYVSYTGLNEKFRACTGYPIGAYIHFRRVQRAAAMLETGKSVTECAMALGYSSSSYFSVVFKRMMDVTPSAYLGSVRRTALGSEEKTLVFDY